jgi:hypothetical protein
MKNIIPVNIDVWQDIINLYESSTISRKLNFIDKDSLESLLANDLKRISKKDVYHEITSGNLIYLEANSSRRIRIGWFPADWEGFPAWGLSVPILNFGGVELSYFKGIYTTTTVSDQLAIYKIPNWEGEPELEESAPITSPILMNLEVPLSYKNQTANPAMILNLRFAPSLLAV